MVPLVTRNDEVPVSRAYPVSDDDVKYDCALTKAVVAILVESSVDVAVVDEGLPVKVGDAKVAYCWVALLMRPNRPVVVVQMSPFTGLVGAVPCGIFNPAFDVVVAIVLTLPAASMNE